MTWDTWRSLTDAEREAQRDLGALTPELVGLEGWRVAVPSNKILRVHKLYKVR